MNLIGKKQINSGIKKIARKNLFDLFILAMILQPKDNTFLKFQKTNKSCELTGCRFRNTFQFIGKIQRIWTALLKLKDEELQQSVPLVISTYICQLK